MTRLKRVRGFVGAGMAGLLCLGTGCSDSPRKVRYPPPQSMPPPPPPATSAAPTATGAPPPEAGTVKVGAAMLLGGAGMSDDAIDRSGKQFVAVFNANVSLFRRCYGAVASRLSGLTGTVDVKVVVQADGTVYELKHLGGSITDPALVDCTMKALSSIRHTPHPGQLFAVETPIEYSP